MSPKKIISFALWGDSGCYNYGALENALLAPRIYPGWICRFYIGKGVYPEVVQKLKKLSHVEIVDRTREGSGYNAKNMLWRHLPFFSSDDSIVLSRDTDSVLNPREAWCVRQWMESGKNFHIIRDHGGHASNAIMGGMFGSYSKFMVRFKSNWEDFYQKLSTANPNRGADQQFLKGIYPSVTRECYIHAGKEVPKGDALFSEEPAPHSIPDLGYLGSNGSGYIGSPEYPHRPPCSFPLVKEVYNLELKNQKKVQQYSDDVEL